MLTIRLWIRSFALPGPRVIEIKPEYHPDSFRYGNCTDFRPHADFICTQSKILPPSLKGVLQTCSFSRAVALARYEPAFEGVYQRTYNFTLPPALPLSDFGIQVQTW